MVAGQIGAVAGSRPKSPRHPDILLARLLLAPAVVFLLVVTLPPFLYALWVSFTRWHLTTSNAPEAFVGLANYAALLHDPSFYNAITNSLVYTVVAVSISFLIGFGLALLLRREIRGKGAYLTLFLLPMVTTPIVIALDFKYLYNPDYGLINFLLGIVGVPPQAFLGSPETALASIMAIEIWEWTPFMALVLLAGLEALPRRTYEAAEVDGASSIQIFRFVTLPQMRKVILIVLLIRSMDALRSFDLIYMTTRGGPGFATETLSIQAWRQSFSFFDMGLGAAIALMMFYVVLVVSWAFMQAAGIGRAPSRARLVPNERQAKRV